MFVKIWNFFRKIYFPLIFAVSLSSCPALSVLAVRSTCSDRAISVGPVPLSSPRHLVVLLSTHRRPSAVFNARLSCPSFLSLLPCSSCPVLSFLSWLYSLVLRPSFPGCPVPVVLSMPSCPNCPLVAVFLAVLP
jgi:hypothetical protein